MAVGRYLINKPKGSGPIYGKKLIFLGKLAAPSHLIELCIPYPPLYVEAGQGNRLGFEGVDQWLELLNSAEIRISTNTEFDRILNLFSIEHDQLIGHVSLREITVRHKKSPGGKRKYTTTEIIGTSLLFEAYWQWLAEQLVEKFGEVKKGGPRQTPTAKRKSILEKWDKAESAGTTQVNFCFLHGISTRTLQRHLSARRKKITALRS